MKKNVSMYSVADRLGISVSEVSRAFTPNYKMNPEKREKIFEAAHEMGYERNEAASRLPRKAITIGIVYSDDFPEFCDEILRGFRNAEKIYSSYKLICDYVELTKIQLNQRKKALADTLKKFIDKGYAGAVVFYSCDGSDEVLYEYSSKIKLALVNYDIPDSSRLFAAVNDTATVAAMAAQLISLYSEHGKTLVFAGNEKHWTHHCILESFKLSANKYGLDIADIYCGVNETEVRTQVAEAFEKYDGITGIYATSAISIPICEYVSSHELSGRVKIVASDIYERLARYISDGTVLASLYQNPTWQAFVALEQLYRCCADGEKSPDRLIAKPEIIMESNLGLYINRQDKEY